MRQHCRLQLVYRDLCEDQSYFLCCSSACIAMVCSCVKGKRKIIMGLLSARMAWLLPCKYVVWYVRELCGKTLQCDKSLVMVIVCHWMEGVCLAMTYVVGWGLRARLVRSRWFSSFFYLPSDTGCRMID